MKQVIDGKTYNTDTGTLIGSYDDGLGCGAFRSYDEALYITPNGRYFLEGSGGPMTRWAEPCGNMTSGGSGIQALVTAEALQWCESNEIDADTIAQYFDLEAA